MLIFLLTAKKVNIVSEGITIFCSLFGNFRKQNFIVMNKLLFIAVLVIAGAPSFSQTTKISYSEPEREDSRRTEFEIVGKLNGNLMVYKNNSNSHAICLYDEDMKLKERVSLDYIPDRWINIDFINYPDFVYMIYQYQRRNIVYCYGVKLDPTGKKIGEPFEMDTTHIGFAANNKIYTTINSDDKQKIMIFKINNRNLKNFLFTTLLFDKDLHLQRKDRMHMPMEERNEYFSDFLLTNEGEMVFSKFLRLSNNSEYISKVFMVTKLPAADTFSVNQVDIGSRLLDELKLKIDNSNKRVLISAFSYQEKRGNIDGLYNLFWDEATNAKISDTLLIFNDDLRALAKGADANRRYAFNDYYVKSITTRKDGGFLVISESLYSSSRGNTFNRWDYWRWGSPWMTPMDYYYWSPYYNYNYGYMPWGNRFFNNNSTRYYAENIMLLSFNKEGGLEWSKVIQKSQYDDQTDNNISFQTLNTGTELHFVFNQYEKRATLLTDQSLDAEGKIVRNPTLKNLDKGYEFMPRFAKQVSGHELIVPCWYRGYLCFAKIDF